MNFEFRSSFLKPITYNLQPVTCNSQLATRNTQLFFAMLYALCAMRFRVEVVVDISRNKVYTLNNELYARG